MLNIGFGLRKGKGEAFFGRGTSVQVDFLFDGRPAHVTCGEAGSTHFACPVSAEEGDVPPSLHTDGTTESLLDLSEFGLEVPESLCIGIGSHSWVRGREGSAISTNFPSNLFLARHTFFHSVGTLLTGETVTAGFEGDKVNGLGAHEALTPEWGWG
jgi:hypothetical protein